MTKRNQLKEYDEDRDEASDLPSSARNILGEAFNLDNTNTFVVIEDIDCDINIDALKKYLSHTYMTYISEGNKIELNGEFIVSEPFTYPEEEQSVDIEFTIKSKNITGAEGTCYLIESNKENVIPTTILVVKKPLTQHIAKTQAIKSAKQGFYEVYKSTSKGKKELYDQKFKEFEDQSNGKINDCPCIKIVCKKDTAATTGGICITLGKKTLPQRVHTTPFNLGKYPHIYTGMKTTITGAPNMFNTYTNKNILAGPLNQRFKDKMFYAVHYWLYLEIAQTEKNRCKKNKKKDTQPETETEPEPEPSQPSQSTTQKIRSYERNPLKTDAAKQYTLFAEMFPIYYKPVVLEGEHTTHLNWVNKMIEEWKSQRAESLEKEFQGQNVTMTIKPKKSKTKKKQKSKIKN